MIKNMWTHEGPSKKNGHMKVQRSKRKNDEHLKAHVLKKRERRKRDSHVSKIISYRERSYLQKEYSFSLPFSTHMHILI